MLFRSDKCNTEILSTYAPDRPETLDRMSFIKDAEVALDSTEHGPAMTHAWLITGPPGSGRSTAATSFGVEMPPPNGPWPTPDCSASR